MPTSFQVPVPLGEFDIDLLAKLKDKDGVDYFCQLRVDIDAIGLPEDPQKRIFIDEIERWGEDCEGVPGFVLDDEAPNVTLGQFENCWGEPNHVTGSNDTGVQITLDFTCYPVAGSGSSSSSGGCTPCQSPSSSSS